MKDITFQAKSSSGDCYNVVIRITDKSVSIICHCQAGLLTQFCKHAKAIIDGDESILFDQSQANILSDFQSYLTTSQRLLDFYQFYGQQLLEIEKQKKSLESQKKQIKAMFARKLQEGI